MEFGAGRILLANRSRMRFFVLALLLSCGGALVPPYSERQPETTPPPEVRSQPEPGSWTEFLRNLTVVSRPILDYRGQPMGAQAKGAGIIPYDVGRSDLQQCADALMRLRAEYLFAGNRHREIAFHFVSGDRYRFTDYLAGRRPRASGNRVVFSQGAAQAPTHASLRRYLDLVYMYASTLSLPKDLKPAAGYAIGTVVLYPGSPGHCFIIIDEKEVNGAKRYKLAEGYTPAQSIYVLRNPADGTPWHELGSGTINTASYSFTNYRLMKFE